jgi:hypothetical protein
MVRCKYGKKETCDNNCRYWIDFEEDDNCCLVSIEKNGEMSLRDIAARLGCTYPAVCLIEQRAIKKLQKMKEIFVPDD